MALLSSPSLSLFTMCVRGGRGSQEQGVDWERKIRAKTRRHQLQERTEEDRQSLKNTNVRSFWGFLLLKRKNNSNGGRTYTGVGDDSEITLSERRKRGQDGSFVDTISSGTKKTADTFGHMMMTHRMTQECNGSRIKVTAQKSRQLPFI